MAGLMDLLNSDLGKQIISGVSGKVGTNEGETSSVLASLMPTLVGAMQNNASTPDGLSGLLGALTGGKHDGGILDNLSGFLGGDDHSDGGNILTSMLDQDGDGELGMSDAIAAATKQGGIGGLLGGLFGK